MLDEELLSLVSASSELLGHKGLQPLIRRIIDEAAKVVRAESCSVILVDEKHEECFFYAASGPYEERLQKTRFDAKLGIAGLVLRSGEAVLAPDANADPRHYKGVDLEVGVRTRSLIAAPLKVNEKTIGVVEAVNSIGRDSFSERDKDLLRIFANFAGVAIQNAQEFERVQIECQAYRDAAARGDVFMGESPAMKKVWRLAERAAAVKSTVLITGPSGAGKEVIAAYIHRLSPRRNKPFVCVNCAAIDENLLNSELFGHEKGAFTGAVERRIGRFEMADEGTLFLDEITECSPATQARLLRVLQEQAFERLGGSEVIRTDARIIAASNADISRCIEEGTFREDLFHRLNVVNIAAPPLRERAEDVPGFLEHFAREFAAELNRSPIEFEPEALDALQHYEWPGNIRELRNLVERLMVLHTSDKVSVRDLEDYLPLDRDSSTTSPASSDQEAEGSSLWQAEKRMIEEALEKAGWNQSKAARALGISRHHLRYRIKKFGIKKPAEA